MANVVVDYYLIRLQEWKMSEIRETVEQMIEMGENRIVRVGKLQEGVRATAQNVVTILEGLKDLQEELAQVESPQTSALTQHEVQVIRDLGLDEVWQQEQRERKWWWNEDRQREQEQERELQELPELPELTEPPEIQLLPEIQQLVIQTLQIIQPGPLQMASWISIELVRRVWVWVREQVWPSAREVAQELAHARGWMRMLAHARGWMRMLAQAPVWLQEALREHEQHREETLREEQMREERLREELLREERKEQVRMVLGKVEGRLRQEQERLREGARQETLRRLLGLVRDRQAQLMESWREQQKRQQEEELLRLEQLQLRRVLQQLRRVLQPVLQVLHRLRRERLRMERASFYLDQLLRPAQASPSLDWLELDRLMDLRVTRDWPALDQQQMELITARLLPSFGQGHKTLLHVILGNRNKFLDQSPYLDALLVFAGLFSAILSAFLIDVRKGLQEDLLLEILHQLRSTQQPFQPTLVSVWVNGLWFSSLTASLTGALVVMLAQSLRRWTIDAEQAKSIFSAPEHLQRRYREIRRIYAHAIFEWEFSFLTTAASTLIYIAVLLFFAGLAVLLYTTQKNLGIGFLSITSTMGLLIIYVALHNLYAPNHN